MNPVGERLGPDVVILGPVGVHNARVAVSLALDLHRTHRKRVPAVLLELAALVGSEVDGSPAHARDGSPGLPMPAPAPSCASDLIDTKEAARMLGCGVRNVVDLLDRGVLASVLTGRRHRLERSEVAALKLRREDTRCA